MARSQYLSVSLILGESDAICLNMNQTTEKQREENLAREAERA